MKKNTKTEQKPQVLFKTGDDINKAISEDRAGFTALTMIGDAFEEYDIFESDSVYIKKVFEYDESQLTVWKHRDGTFHLGFAYNNFGDISINCLTSIKRYKKREITLVGVVVGTLRSNNNRLKESADLEQEPETKDETEITAVCGECKTQLSGTREFIKKMGWKIKGENQLCLHCDLF